MVDAWLAGSAAPTPAQLEAIEVYAADVTAYARRAWTLCGTAPR
jgi:hypothetical protein